MQTPVLSDAEMVDVSGVFLFMCSVLFAFLYDVLTYCLLLTSLVSSDSGEATKRRPGWSLDGVFFGKEKRKYVYAFLLPSTRGFVLHLSCLCLVLDQLDHG